MGSVHRQGYWVSHCWSYSQIEVTFFLHIRCDLATNSQDNCFLFFVTAISWFFRGSSHLVVANINSFIFISLCWVFVLSMLQLTPHDVVNLKLNKGDASTPSLGQGIVYRIKVNTYSNILPYVQFFLQYLGGNLKKLWIILSTCLLSFKIFC